MEAAKMMMAGKEDFDHDNEKHNALIISSKKKSYGLWVIRHLNKIVQSSQIAVVTIESL
jgi:hypothetical protein